MNLAEKQNNTSSEIDRSFDYSFVDAIARIALYDDLKSAPRITEIKPCPTDEYIENLASKIYEQSKMAGGSIPYTAIREVSENFIHAQFTEITVSILNQGNTIRFADQGPGIPQKDKAQIPGFTSAVEPMKKYIRGVGSGLPIVKEYLDFSNGTITIEDNLKTGAVVTVSLVDPQKESEIKGPSKSLAPHLNQREKEFLIYFAHEGALGITDLSQISGTPQSSTYVTLQKLEEHGLIEKVGKKRILTDLGFQVANSL